MPDSLIRPTPIGRSVTSCLAALTAVRDLLNANEDASQEDALGQVYGEAKARFVTEPVRSASDALAKLEWVVGEGELDPIDEKIVQGVIAFLRSKAAA